MKMSRIALAMLVAAPLAAANAGVTVTPLMLGYTFQDTQHNNNGSDGELTTSAELQDDLFVGAALGVELTPWLGFEAEYNQVKGDVNGGITADAEYKQTQINGNFYATSDLITKNYDSKIKPYVLLGAGHYTYEFDGVARGTRGNEEEGTLGFILNQSSQFFLKDLVPDLWQADFPVFVGGPVEMDTIHFIHRCYDKMNSGEEIAEGIYWGGNFETLKILVNNYSISSTEIKFFLGYSGWSTGQLAEEITENTWIVSDQFTQDIIFSDNEEELWREVIVSLGSKFAHVSNFPTDPSLN